MTFGDAENRHQRALVFDGDARSIRLPPSSGLEQRPRGLRLLETGSPGPQGITGGLMITYIGLLSFTEKGLQSIKDTTKRAAAAKEAAKKAGVNMRDVFWTLGDYDVVCVLEAEDEAAITAFSITTAQQGNVRTRTLRAFSAAEMDKILAKVK